MKKFTALLLCLVLVFAICACGKEAAEPENTAEVVENTNEAPEENPAGMPNPCTEYDSLEEINAVAGGNLIGPGVMGVADKVYMIIDCGSYKIAEYQFDVNGMDYTFRCAKVTEDISGVYMGENGTAFSDLDAEQDGIRFNSDNEYKCAQWFVDDVQYVLTVADKDEMEQETFEGIADELAQMTLTYGE